MHSWIFRNRRRLEAIYGLAPQPPGKAAEERRASPKREAVLIPVPRRGARRAG